MLRDFTAFFHRVAVASAIAFAIGATQLAACGIKGPLKPAQPPAPATGTPSSEQTSAPTPPSPEPRP